MTTVNPMNRAAMSSGFALSGVQLELLEDTGSSQTFSTMSSSSWTGTEISDEDHDVKIVLTSVAVTDFAPCKVTWYRTELDWNSLHRNTLSVSLSSEKSHWHTRDTCSTIAAEMSLALLSWLDTCNYRATCLGMWMDESLSCMQLNVNVAGWLASTLSILWKTHHLCDYYKVYNYY